MSWTVRCFHHLKILYIDNHLRYVALTAPTDDKPILERLTPCERQAGVVTIPFEYTVSVLNDTRTLSSSCSFAIVSGA